jgi:hypothetical protein
MKAIKLTGHQTQDQVFLPVGQQNNALSYSTQPISGNNPVFPGSL